MLLWKLIFAGIIVFAVILFMRLLFLKQQIRNINTHMERLARHDTRETIKVSLVDGDLERLAECLNTVISEQKQLYIDARNHEDRLKKQIADISHDFRTPLSAIRGYVQLLEENHLTVEKRKQFLRIIEQKSDVLKNLINDFFELSVIDSDEYTLNLQRTDATSLTTQVLLSYYSAFAERDQKPQVELPDHAVYLLIDAIAFQRIIQNLLNNALLYTEGEIQLSLKNKGDGCTVFSIRNETTSLSKEDIERLFDRFYRADMGRSGTNTGLGLYIVKTLAEKMNARIEAELEEGWISISIFFSVVDDATKYKS